MGSGVAVLIPVGGELCDHRERACQWIVDRYHRLHPDWNVVIGAVGEPWSKGAALADAYRQIADDIDTVVLADADSYVDADVLRLAVDGARRSGWAMPHQHVYRLNEAETERVYAGSEARLDHERLARGVYRGVKGGGIVALTRGAYERVNGIDPRFVGWGGEDVSFARALLCLVGRPVRHAGDLIHLWHPHPAPSLRGSDASEALVERYRDAANRPAAMLSLVHEWSYP